jgi:hypothetical protein
MECVFYEMGVGSIRTLHGFYQTRVLRYYEQVLNKCASLHDEYSSLAVPVHRSASDNEIIRYVPCIVKREYHVMGYFIIHTVVAASDCFSPPPLLQQSKH